MITRFRQLWRARPRLTAAFLLACAVTLFFTASFAYRTIYWSTHQDMPVRGWMTVGYIARSWDLDGREISALAGLPLPEQKGHPLPLREIALDLGVPVAEIVAKVEAALVSLRAADE
jgi:hypothetical protein